MTTLQPARAASPPCAALAQRRANGPVQPRQPRPAKKRPHASVNAHGKLVPSRPSLAQARALSGLSGPHDPRLNHAMNLAVSTRVTRLPPRAPRASRPASTNAAAHSTPKAPPATTVAMRGATTAARTAASLALAMLAHTQLAPLPRHPPPHAKPMAASACPS